MCAALVCKVCKVRLARNTRHVQREHEDNLNSKESIETLGSKVYVLCIENQNMNAFRETFDFVF